MIRSVTLTVVSMVLLFPGPSVQMFWIGYFCSFLGRRLIQYGGSGDTLKYFGWVGIRRDGATVISKLSGPISVSMSEKSLVGETEVSASGKSSRYSSIIRLASVSEESYTDETSDTFFFKMLFNFAGLAIPLLPDGDRCTRCRAEGVSWTRPTPGRKSGWRSPMLTFGGTCWLTRSVATPPSVSALASSGVASEEVERSVAACSPPGEESGPSADRGGAGEELAETPSVVLCK